MEMNARQTMEFLFRPLKDSINATNLGKLVFPTDLNRLG